jgi:hypothetical protein
MPQKNSVATRILVFDFDLFIGGLFRKKVINGARISLHKTGFPAILSRHVASDIGDKQGACEKCDVYAPLNWVPISQPFREMGSPFAQQEVKYVQRKS